MRAPRTTPSSTCKRSAAAAAAAAAWLRWFCLPSRRARARSRRCVWSFSHCRCPTRAPPRCCRRRPAIRSTPRSCLPSSRVRHSCVGSRRARSPRGRWSCSDARLQLCRRRIDSTRTARLRRSWRWAAREPSRWACTTAAPRGCCATPRATRCSGGCATAAASARRTRTCCPRCSAARRRWRCCARTATRAACGCCSRVVSSALRTKQRGWRLSAAAVVAMSEVSVVSVVSPEAAGLCSEMAWTSGRLSCWRRGATRRLRSHRRRR
mmetsp:Transcript_36355/g.79898  ORF Transcript_36355/g.79898 Transcript_36355/m.79898 type:complete len:266 (+) Transcript_36355:1215-2012(+)